MGNADGGILSSAFRIWKMNGFSEKTKQNEEFAEYVGAAETSFQHLEKDIILIFSSQTRKNFVSEWKCT